MKKIHTMILIGVLCCGILAGCSGTQSEEGLSPVQSPTPSAPVTPSGTAIDNNSDVQSGDASSSAQADSELVDLTQLSTTMVYAEVYNMMMTPEDYVGKTVKTNGVCYTSYNPDLEIYYHFVIIEDAAACCAQGLEFVLNGEHTSPGDYPADETPIEVTGVWGSYEEAGNTYYHIAADSVTVL